VTKITFQAGTAPRTLQALLRVSGETLYAFVSSSPLYRDLSTELSSGTQVANVKALQSALKEAGYYDGRVDGDFDSPTEAALEEWQDAKGMSATGVLDITRFVWVPEGASLSAWKVAVGDKVSSTAQLARVMFNRPLLAQALVDQEDVDSLRVGQSASLAIDGYDSKALKGEVVSVSTKPSSSASSGGSSGGVSYAVTLKVKSLPAFARRGMTGTLSVVLARRSDVLVVPSSAVVGSGSSATVRLLQDGALVYRSVTTGLVTSSLTEITGGLAEGEKVVTSVITDSMADTRGGMLRFEGGLPGAGGAGAPPSGSSGGGPSGAGQ
jgi:peptidoglycan hydrolase-like protein with peptidoglycan-binding domain